MILSCVGSLPLAGCVTGIGHSQGEMAGEVATDSVILQSRLTALCTPFPCELTGTEGWGRFELSTSPAFEDSFLTDWIEALPENDFILKKRVTGLEPGTRYHYRLLYGPSPAGGASQAVETGPTCTFRTLDTEAVEGEVSFVVVTGMNYFVFHLFPGPPHKPLGYPALETILRMKPDFFVGTGDNVYYDAFAVPARDLDRMRWVWHKQLVQPRFVSLFAEVPTYWEKDDHDFRYNDADRTGALEPSTELGMSTFLEQLPVADPEAPAPVTYRTVRVNKLLQIWLTEGRDYRSPNMMEDGPDKTLWGEAQRAWLRRTLLESDADFKLLISPTPLIGPDDKYVPWPAPGGDRYKRDNHTNPPGFRHEGEAFFAWLADNGFLEKNFFILCGDRHWQYHSIRPDGFEELSCGALVDANARLGRSPGDPNSTDPEGLIAQPYAQCTPAGGFLKVTVRPALSDGDGASCDFTFHDVAGAVRYSVTKFAD